MSDEFPRDLGELDARISADVLAGARQGVRDAERYALARECDPEPPPASDFPKWSEISQPRTVEYGPYIAHLHVTCARPEGPANSLALVTRTRTPDGR
jgi:hypothetical protein